jgi:hypothetical protein
MMPSSFLDCTEWQGDVANELERREKESAVANFKVRYIIMTFARRKWKTMKKPRRNSHSPGSNLTGWLSEQEPHFRRVLVSRKKRLLASSLPPVRSQESNRLPLEGFACKGSWSLVWKSAEKIQIWLKSDKISGTFHKDYSKVRMLPVARNILLFDSSANVISCYVSMATLNVTVLYCWRRHVTQQLKRELTVALPWQQWLRKRATTYVHCLSCFCRLQRKIRTAVFVSQYGLKEERIKC